MAMHQTLMSFRHDPNAVRGRKVERELVKRVLGLTRPYRALLIGFVIAVIAAAGVAVLPPLLFRALLDDAVPNKNTELVLALAIGAVALAIASAGLGLLQRWYSARIGEGLIYDLRVALFDHVQRLPVSFFTRTQTGALMSRLNNDVIGAQQAVTGTLGTVVSNVITLVITLAVMLALDWRLTILTLIVLPAFIIPARRIGRKLQVATREGMQLNASMNNTVVERFNVAGALVVKLFGSHDRERDLFAGRARRVRDIGITTAMYSRVLFVALGFVAAVGTAVVYYLGGRLVIEDAITIGTLAAFVIYVGQIYQPLTQLTNARVDVMTALVSFERVFEVLDFPPLIDDHPGAIDLAALGRRCRRQDRVRPRVVPASAGRHLVDPVPRGGWRRRGRRRRPGRVDPARRLVHGRARRAGGTRRSVGGGEDHDCAARAPRPRCRRRPGARRRSRRARRHAPLPARDGRHGHAGPTPLPRDHRGEPPVREARRDRRRSRRGMQGGADPRSHREPPRRIRHGRR